MLELRDLTAGYGKVTALAGVSLKVEEGAITSIVGSNGAGKTTLLRCIAGHHKPSRGDILLDGADITASPAHEIARKRVALVPEGRGLFADMTVEENLMLGAFSEKDRGEVGARRDQVLELFPRLSDRMKQISGTMSGGEQQLLAIARGLMSGPRLIMLDEPSLGVMPSIVNRIFEVLDDLRKSGRTVLLIEQNVEKSLAIADYAYVLRTGEVAAEGTGPELFASDLVRKAYLGH